MKRDMDLIRELLLKLEAYPKVPEEMFTVTPATPEVQVGGYDTTQINYHLSLIQEAGLVHTGHTKLPVGIVFLSPACAGSGCRACASSRQTSWRDIPAASGTGDRSGSSVIEGIARMGESGVRNTEVRGSIPLHRAVRAKGP